MKLYAHNVVTRDSTGIAQTIIRCTQNLPGNLWRGVVRMHEVEKGTVGNIFPQGMRLSLDDLIPSDVGHGPDFGWKAQHLAFKQSQSGVAAKLVTGLKEHLKTHANAEQRHTGLRH